MAARQVIALKMEKSARNGLFTEVSAALKKHRKCKKNLKSQRNYEETRW